MRYDDTHISDEDLIRSADGELSSRHRAAVDGHLEACWRCRARMDEIEQAIADFVRVHRREMDARIPPAAGPRAQFTARLGEAARRPSPWYERLPLVSGYRHVHAAVFGILVLGVTAPVVFSVVPANRGDDREIVLLTGPDPELTPGATVPMTATEICQATPGDRDPRVPVSVGRLVFAAYGISDPPPGAYELDYLIAPELGGSSDARNLWPQAYETPVWNAHVKDALEDRLRQRVCQGEVSLSAAQMELAMDWIAAYKKHFETDVPRSEHREFRKDAPWIARNR